MEWSACRVSEYTRGLHAVTGAALLATSRNRAVANRRALIVAKKNINAYGDHPGVKYAVVCATHAFPVPAGFYTHNCRYHKFTDLVR